MAAIVPDRPDAPYFRAFELASNIPNNDAAGRTDLLAGYVPTIAGYVVLKARELADSSGPLVIGQEEPPADVAEFLATAPDFGGEAEPGVSGGLLDNFLTTYVLKFILGQIRDPAWMDKAAVWLAKIMPRST